MPKPPKRAPKKSAARTRTETAQMELSVHTGADAGGTATKKAAGSKGAGNKGTGSKGTGKKVAAKKVAAKTVGKVSVKRTEPNGSAKPGVSTKKAATKKATVTKTVRRAVRSGGAAARTATLDGATADVLDRLFEVVTLRRDADPNISHSARLLSRGTAKVAQKFGEEAVECLIEAVAGNSAKLIGESADVLYHLIVMWVDAGVHPNEIWAELQRREGTSGIAEKLGRFTRPTGE